METQTIIAPADPVETAAADAPQFSPGPFPDRPHIMRTKNGALFDTIEKGFVRKDGSPAGKPGRKPGSVSKPKEEFTSAKPADPVGDKPTPKRDIPASIAAAIPKPEYTAADKAILAKQTVGVHKMLALMTGIPELEIGDDEGKILAEAMTAVSREYGVAVSGKTAASMQMLAACAMVYAPRALAFTARVKAAKPKVPPPPKQQGTTRGETVAPSMPAAPQIYGSEFGTTISAETLGSETVN